MRLSNVSIKWKLIGMCVILVSIPVGGLGIWAYYSSEQEIYRSTENKLREQATMIASHIKTAVTMKQAEVDKVLNIAHCLLYQDGSPELDFIRLHSITAMNQSTKTTKAVQIPIMKIGEEQLLDNTRIVDNVHTLVGGTASIFQVIPDGLLRIATTITQADGNRGTGTYLPPKSPAYQAIMSGMPFRSRERVAETWFETIYEPLKDAQGKIIGALNIGQEDASETIFDNLANIVVGKTGYTWVLAADRHYVLSYKRQRDGENILNAQDADGRYFLHEWIENAKHLEPGESVADYHYWKNPGETEARLKISTYAYVPEREWLVGAGAYLDDFSDQLIYIRHAAITISIAGILLSSVVAYLFMSSMVKKFKFLATQMQEVANGNLTLEFPAARQDEIGTMSLTGITKHVGDSARSNLRNCGRRERPGVFGQRNFCVCDAISVWRSGNVNVCWGNHNHARRSQANGATSQSKIPGSVRQRTKSRPNCSGWTQGH